HRRRLWPLDRILLVGPSMKEQDTLEKVAIGFAAVTLFGLVWFWAVQVGWVIETLEMAYG
ncbi:MAG: hypothetical protein VX140_05235, partial [Pseudomonadota bacterium]|nr:hypothetical protein [Pseudomonadota bacterium]